MRVEKSPSQRPSDRREHQRLKEYVVDVCRCGSTKGRSPSQRPTATEGSAPKTKGQSPQKKKKRKEKTIDQVVDRFAAKPNDLSNVYKELAAEQPAIISMLYSTDLKTLTEEETDLLFFIVAVLYESVKAKNGDLDQVAPEDLEVADDANWAKMMAAGNGNFRDRITPFFDGYLQEDLLAFTEDALLDDDEQVVSGIGREAIFVTAKTVIDVLS